MSNLEEFGIGIVENDLFAGDDRSKLILIAHKLGLDQPSSKERAIFDPDVAASAALEVLTAAAASLKKIREIAAKCAA